MKAILCCLGPAILLTACRDAPTVVSTRVQSRPSLVLQPAIGPATSQVIQACVNASSGVMKVVAPGQHCTLNETLLQWNVAGPVGPTGPAGPANVLVYFARATGQSARVLCPSGSKVVGGGGFSEDPSVGLQQNFPVDSTGANPSRFNTAGWQAATVNFAGSVQVFVLCASS